jgi:hypothetical protein
MIGKILPAAIALALAAAAPAAAQEAYKTSGFVLGAYLTGAGVTVEDSDEADSGAGLTLRLGYGFGDRLAVYAAGTGSSMEDGDYNMGHFDLGLRYLLSTARLRPYAQGAISGRALVIPFLGTDLEARGSGVTFGGGLEYSFGRTAALDVGLDYTVGKYTEGRVSGEPWEDLGNESFSSNSARFNVGVVWRP